jgi:nuclease HARBI1
VQKKLEHTPNIMPTVWNTHLERQTFEHLLEATIMLLETEISDASSSISDMDWSFDTVLDLLDDDDDDDDNDDDSTIGAALKLVVEYGTMIYGEANVGRRVYGEDLLIQDLPDVTAQEFRFRKKDLQTMAHLLWPKAISLDMVTGTYDRICLRNRNYVHFETGLILFLYRMTYPTRISPEMENRFNMSPTRISLVLDFFAQVMHQIATPYLNDITIWHHHVEECAHAIWEATGEIEDHVWAFIDGTLRHTCRPSEHQQEVYSGHKRKHGMKYQSVYLPMGFYAHMPDPEMGARHDGFMLGNSNLEEQLEIMFPNKDFGLFGDPAYPQSELLLGGYTNHNLDERQQRYNTIMSGVRECVEWGFASVIQQFHFLDFSKQMKIMKMPVGCYYIAGCFLQNLRTCFYGNQTCKFFNMTPMKIEDYLELSTHSLLLQHDDDDDDDDNNN